MADFFDSNGYNGPYSPSVYGPKRSEMTTYGPYRWEMAQPKPAPAQTPASGPQIYPQQAASPMPMPQGSYPIQGNGLGLLSGLANGMQSPLFQSGAAMVAAGAQGLNPGSGFLVGNEAASKTAQNAAELWKKQREMQQMQLQDQYFSGMNPNDKQWAGLPPAIVNMAKNLRNPELLIKAYTAKMDIDQQIKSAQALGQIKLANDLQLKKQEMELEMQQLVKRLDMLKGLQGQGQPAPRLRYNPAISDLE